MYASGYVHDEDIRTRRLRAVNAATTAINASVDSANVVEKVVEPLLDATGLTCGVLYLTDDSGNRLVGQGDRGFRLGLPAGIDTHDARSESLPSRAFRSNRAVLFDAEDHAVGLQSITPSERQCIEPEGIKSAVACRIASGSMIYGVLAMCSHDAPHDQVESEQTIEFVQTVAGQIAIALDRSRLYEDVRARAEDSVALYEIGRMLNGAIDPESALTSALGHACRKFGLTWSSVRLSEPLGGRTEYSCGAARDRDAGHGTELVVPLTAMGIPLGSLVSRRATAFTLRERLLAGEFADVIAVALWKRRLYVDSKQLGVAEERSRLAREIHDTLSQRFYAIQLHLTAADSSESRHIHAAKRQAEQGMVEARESVRTLWSDPVDRCDLTSTIGMLVEEFEAYSALPSSFEATGADWTLADDAFGAVTRSVQELLRNVARHAGATQLRVNLSQSVCGIIRLEIDDDGIGFDSTERSSESDRDGGFGLRSIRERIVGLGGTFEVASRPGGGTRALIEVAGVAPADQS